MKNVNEQNASTATTPKATQTEEIKPELTDDEIASVAGGAGSGGYSPPPPILPKPPSQRYGPKA